MYKLIKWHRFANYLYSDCHNIDYCFMKYRVFQKKTHKVLHMTNFEPFTIIVYTKMLSEDCCLQINTKNMCKLMKYSLLHTLAHQDVCSVLHGRLQ